MERLVREDIIDGVLDVTTTEWADELVGGVLGLALLALTQQGNAESHKLFRRARLTW